jgi:hypothetical protein
MRNSSTLKPAVPKSVLLFLAGFIWFCVGTMLLVHACSWLSNVPGELRYIFFGVGFVAALVIHHFGFQKIADKNINRILPMLDSQCIFAFFSWKSYIIIIVMVGMGRLFRSSEFPKAYLAILYTAIGLALVLSSLKYIRGFIKVIKAATVQSPPPAIEKNTKQQQ